MTRKIRFKSIIGVGLLAILFLSLVFALVGRRGSGIVTKIADIPYVGSYFKDFRAEGNTKYAFERNHRGQVMLMFSGTTSESVFREFFSGKKSGAIRPEYAPQWVHRLEHMNLDPNDFPIDNSEDNLRGSREIGRAYVEIHYIRKDGRFTGCLITN